MNDETRKCRDNALVMLDWGSLHRSAPKAENAHLPNTVRQNVGNVKTQDGRWRLTRTSATTKIIWSINK